MTLDTIILSAYFSILSCLCLFGAHRLWLIRLYRKHKHQCRAPKELFSEGQLPRVTVQLPVFNEKFVVGRLIDAAVGLDYPKHLLDIQVLDDSTDETVHISQKKVHAYREQGVDIRLLHRTDRTGFKAGALKAGLQKAKGEFIAIFDADFIPQSDILRKTIHYFTDDHIGMVQTRWGHLNRETNWLTRIQAIMLDAHFMIEHASRCMGNLFFNFNGTAGMWRRKAIEDAGGWEHDTLTEDLDLSYRAQMKGWKFTFLPRVTCPGELPEEVKAFKSQQHRWAKGSIQVMKKVLPRVWRQPLPLAVKLEATFHLTGNLAYLLMIINCTFFMVPSMMIRQNHGWWEILFVDGPLFLFASLSFVLFYLASQKAIYGHTRGKKRVIPALMATGIGLGVNNARAVVEGLLNIQSGFVRTPKTGGKQRPGSSTEQTGRYRLPNSAWAWLELALAALFSTAIVWALFHGVWGSLPFLILFQNGFLYMGFQSLREEWLTNTSLLGRPNEKSATST